MWLLMLERLTKFLFINAVIIVVNSILFADVIMISIAVSILRMKKL